MCRPGERRSSGGALGRRIPAGVDGVNDLFRRLVAGGGHDDGAGQLFVELLQLGCGLIQPVLDDLRIKAGGGYKVYALRKGHVAHNGQTPSGGQGRALVLIGYRAAALANAGAPALCRRAAPLRRRKADIELICAPHLEGKRKICCRAVAFIHGAA